MKHLHQVLNEQIDDTRQDYQSRVDDAIEADQTDAERRAQEAWDANKRRLEELAAEHRNNPVVMLHFLELIPGRLLVA